MHEGTVQSVAQVCTVCGAGPVHPREEQSYDRLARETIIEAVWCCSRCGARFAQGVISRIPDQNEKR